MANLSVTEVEVKLFSKDKTKIRAFANIVVNNALAIKNLKVIDGTNGLFVSMPSQKNTKTNEFVDIVYPINKESRKIIHDAIIDAYHKEVDSGISTKKKTIKKEENDELFK